MSAWDAYEREAHERWKALSWRERYPSHVILRIAILVAVVVAFVWAALH